MKNDLSTFLVCCFQSTCWNKLKTQCVLGWIHLFILPFFIFIFCLFYSGVPKLPRNLPPCPMKKIENLLQKLSKIFTNAFTAWPLANSMAIERVGGASLLMWRAGAREHSVRFISESHNRCGPLAPVRLRSVTNRSKQVNSAQSSQKNLIVLLNSSTAKARWCSN